MRTKLTTVEVVAMVGLVLGAIWATPALAQVTTSTVVSDPDGLAVGLAARAFRSKEWLVLAGILLMGGVKILRGTGLTEKIPDYLVPWKTMGLAILASIAIGLQDRESWDSILVTGVTVGLVAVGGWESLGKALRALIARLRGHSKEGS